MFLIINFFFTSTAYMYAYIDTHMYGYVHKNIHIYTCICIYSGVV